MNFIVQSISSSVELVYQNEQAVINVYPQYHQVGDYVYTTLQPSDWSLTSAGYAAQIPNGLITTDSIPMIQLVYTTDTSHRADELNIFNHLTQVTTLSGKMFLYCSIRPTVNIRLRFRVLNKFDLAVFLNRYFANGIGFSIDDDSTVSAVLTAYNPTKQSVNQLSAQIPVCSTRQSGTMTPDLFNRLAKLESAYNAGFEFQKKFRIKGYATSSGGSEISTEYADYAAVIAISANTWYQECVIESVSEDVTFTTAELLFNNQGATSLDITRLYTSNVTDMNHMLADNADLEEIIGLPNLMTSRVTDMSYMFENDTSLTHIDLSALRLNNLTTIEGMFKNCSALQELRLTSINFMAQPNDYLYEQPDIFTGIPNNCHVIVNTEVEATMIRDTYPNLTNVTTAS